MCLISTARVCIEVIAGRRNNGFHFSSKGKNGVPNAIGPSGVKPTSTEVIEQLKIANLKPIMVTGDNLESRHHRFKSQGLF